MATEVSDEQAEETAEEQQSEEQTADDEHQDDDAQTYPAKVVKDLRKESATYRERARTAETKVDELSRALFAARVEATQKLVDPGDLPFAEDLLDDPEALDSAIDELITKRPHYAKRKVTGRIGQGERSHDTGPQDFSHLLRG